MTMNQHTNNEGGLTWALFVEGRKEILEYQKIRAQIIGFKITFVSAAVAVIIANVDKIPIMLLAMPGYAAVFFDFLVASYTFDIRRVGHYCREHLEPLLRINAPQDLVMWEEYMSRPSSQQRFTVLGNVGLTMLALVPAIGVAVVEFDPLTSPALMVPLLGLAAYDVYASLAPNRFREVSEESDRGELRSTAEPAGRS